MHKILMMGLALIVLFGCASEVRQDSEKPFEFRGVRFGMTVDEVKAIETNEFVYDEIFLGDHALHYKLNCNGSKLFLSYYFLSNKVWSIYFSRESIYKKKDLINITNFILSKFSNQISNTNYLDIWKYKGVFLTNKISKFFYLENNIIVEIRITKALRNKKFKKIHHHYYYILTSIYEEKKNNPER